MRFLCWAIFCLLLGSSAGWSLEEEVNVDLEEISQKLGVEIMLHELSIGTV